MQNLINIKKMHKVKRFQKAMPINKSIEKHLLKSEEDIRMGRTRKAKEVFEELEEKYGF